MYGGDFIRIWLRKIRKEESKTQKDLAEMLNLDTTTINKYELGERRPRIENAKRISEVLKFKKYDIDWTKFYEK